MKIKGKEIVCSKTALSGKRRTFVGGKLLNLRNLFFVFWRARQNLCQKILSQSHFSIIRMKKDLLKRGKTASQRKNFKK